MSTWTLSTQRFVALLILEPDTPGGFKFNMAWRFDSSSVTGDVMVSFLFFLCVGACVSR